MREGVHFAHGNGFPSPCYNQLFLHLKNQYDICYIDKIGHNIDYPVTDNWHNLVDELIESVKSQYKAPVIALGHSLGGVLSFRAAIEEPSLFKALIMLDSPIIGLVKSQILKLSKAIGLIDHITPAHRSRGRRKTWPTKESAIEYLKGRPLFEHFTDACINDYIEFGMTKTNEGYSLRFDKHIEYQIYRTIPHILHKYKGKLSIPAALIYGNRSNVIDKVDIKHMQNHYNMSCYEIAGSHMFPMENPSGTAKLVNQAVSALLDYT
jgi:pimeloyl-ACP methyl ester carboxylesterase